MRINPQGATNAIFVIAISLMLSPAALYRVIGPIPALAVMILGLAAGVITVAGAAPDRSARP